MLDNPNIVFIMMCRKGISWIRSSVTDRQNQ